MFADVSSRIRLNTLLILAFGYSLLIVTGCDKPPTFHKPKIDASKAVNAAMIEFDKNLDDKLEADELEKVPGIKALLPTADKDRDGKLSKGEIEARLAVYATDDTALMQFQCQLMFDDQPLDGAVVRIVPESFLGSEVKSATGKSNASGNVSLAIPDEPVRGVHCGMYRLEISKLDERGKEIIPKKYNTETTLGIEIAPDSFRGERGEVIHLKSS